MNSSIKRNQENFEKNVHILTKTQPENLIPKTMKNDDDHSKYSPPGHMYGHVNGIHYNRYPKKSYFKLSQIKNSF